MRYFSSKKVAVICLLFFLGISFTSSLYAEKGAQKNKDHKESKKEIRLADKHSGKKLESLKKAMKSSNEYTIVLSSKDDISLLKQKFEGKGQGIKIKKIGKGSYVLKVPLDKANLITGISSVESGIIPTTLDGYTVVEPEAFELSSMAYFDGEEIENMWGQDFIGAYDFQEDLVSLPQVKVGVMDTGIDGSHPDLVMNYDSSLSYDFVSDSQVQDDIHGHGTQVAGVIGASVNGQGIFGANANASLVALKVLDDNGIGTSYDIVEAIQYAIDNNIKVLNMSFGGVGDPTTSIVCDAIAEAQDQGVYIIASAGNNGQELTNTIPAVCPDVIGVGSLNADGTVSGFSNYGSLVDFFAPGADIYTTNTGSTYITKNGTSFSAAFVTGLVSKELAFSPTLPFSTMLENIEAGYDLLTGASQSGGQTGGTGTGTTASGTTETTPEDFSQYMYYSGTFLHDGQLYGNSLYGPEYTFSTQELAGVETYTYQEYQDILASQQGGNFSALSVPMSGMTGNWELNGNANDTSGNGRNGIPAYISWVSSGRSDGKQVASFTPGSNSRIDVTNTAFNRTAVQDFTWSFRFKSNDIAQNQLLLGTTQGGGANYGIYFELYASKLRMQFYPSGGQAAVVSSPTVLQTGVEYIVTFVYKDKVLYCYINGVLNSQFSMSSATGNIYDTNTKYILGASYHRSENAYVVKFNGKMSDVYVHDWGLTSADVSNLYNGIVNPAPNSNTSSNQATSTGSTVQSNPTSHYVFTEKTTEACIANKNTWDVGPTAQVQESSEGDPVNLATGEFDYENTFMSIPGKGMNYELTLTNKNQLYYNGPVGINWDHTYNQYLVVEGNGNVLLYKGKLGIYRFIKTGSTFAYNAGLKAQLTLSGSLYTLTYDSGKVVEFNTDKKVSKIRDVYGNALNMTYSGGLLSQVTDTLGRNINYTYFSHNRLKDVTDFNGRKVELSYFSTNTSTGSIYDLKEIKVNNGTGATKTIKFEYTVGGDDTTNHSITKLYDAKGQTYVTNTYSNDRVATQLYGTGTINYNYTLSGSLVTKNTVTDRVGNVVEYFYDSNGSNTQTKHTTSTGTLSYYYTYNSLGYIETEKYPLGNGKKYVYDSVGNLIQIRQKADITAADSSDDIVTSYTYTSYNRPATMTSPLGIVTQYTYNGSGSLIQEKVLSLTTHSGATYDITKNYSYDTLGQLVYAQDGAGNETSYSYSGGLLITKTSGTGSTTKVESYTYNSYGHPLTVTDGEGKVTTYQYDSFNRVGTGTTDEGIVTTYTYDANDNLTQKVVGGMTTSLTYDVLDHPLTTTVSRGSGANIVTSLTYSNNEKPLTTQTGTGAKQVTTYNEFGSVLTQTSVMDPNDSSKNITTTYTYDNNNRVTTKTDPMGNVTTYTYDLYDRLTRETLSDGTYRQLTYFKDGTIESEAWYTAGNTLKTKSVFTYDGLGHIVKQVQYLDPVNSSGAVTTTSEYNANFQPLKVTDSLGNSTLYSYDIFGRQISSTDALGNIATTVYDKRDLVTSKTLTPSTGTGTTTSYVYDDDRRLVSETNALSDTKTYVYNALGQVTQVTDEAGNQTVMTYDHQGNILTQTQYLPSSVTAVTTMVYDDRGNMVSVTDAEGNETLYEYDALNRNTKVTYADGKNIVYTYNKNSQLVTTTDPNGTVVTHTYNSRNQLTAKSIATGTGVLGVTSETYTYDTLGRLATATDSGGHPLTFSYDPLNRLTQETQSGATVGYVYDTSGNLTSITNSNGKVTSYGYDALNRNTTISSSGATVATYTYTGLLQTQTNLANGKTETKTYDSLYRLQTLNNGVKSYTYTYDDVSNITSDTHKNYTYDPLYRLTHVQTTGTGTTLEQYSYDKVGNRNTSSQPSPQGEGDIEYTTNTLNQYTSQTGALQANYTYDNNGNLTSDGIQTYSYDYKNRLIQVKNSQNQIIASYQYDVLGRRYEKTTPTETTNYIYSNDNVLEEIKTIGTQAYRKQYINGLGTDNLVAYTVEEPDLTPAEIEELDFCNERVLPFATQFNGYGHTTITSRCDTLSSSGSVIVENTYYFAKNHLGSVVGITDSSGNVVSEYDYDTFGTATLSSGFETWNTRLFTGREFDSETGLYYNRARYYSSTLGRFTSRDPIGIKDDINLYSYTANNPVNYIDRMGTEKQVLNNKLVQNNLVNPIDNLGNDKNLLYYLNQGNKDFTAWFFLESTRLGGKIGQLSVSSYMLGKFMHGDGSSDYYGNEHWISQKVKDSDFYKKQINDLKNYVSNNPEKFSENGYSLALKGDIGDGLMTDFPTSFGTIDGEMKATKNKNGEIETQFNIKDTYTFNYLYGDGTVIENPFNVFAKYYQERGYGTPFNWELNITEKFNY